jgi:hypothetical protein
MKALLTAIAILMSLSATSQAAETESSSHSCRAKEIEKFYCPTYSGWWWGPYYDRGCSVKCEAGQKAVCNEASCDDSQSGEAVYSSCFCE